MTEKRKFSKLDAALWTVVAVSITYLVWEIIRAGDGPSSARAMHYLSRLCQGCARTFGQWGIATERAYFSILERERMI